MNCFLNFCAVASLFSGLIAYYFNHQLTRKDKQRTEHEIDHYRKWLVVSSIVCAVSGSIIVLNASW